MFCHILLNKMDYSNFTQLNASLFLHLAAMPIETSKGIFRFEKKNRLKIYFMWGGGFLGTISLGRVSSPKI